MNLCAAVSASAQEPWEAGEDAVSAETILVLGERLEESVPEELEEYGSRLEIISGEDIDKAGYTDTSQVLQYQVPGLYLAPQSGAFDYVNMSLLGSRSSDILVLVDGVRMSNRLYATTSPFETIPAHMIERIEVLKGGQGLYYGTQAVAGIINVVTKGFSGQTDGAIEAGIDTNDGRHINGYARGGVGDHYFVGYASYDQADGFYPFREEDVQPSATYRPRRYDSTTFGLKYAFEPTNAFRVSGSYQHTEGSYDRPYAEDVHEAYNTRNEEIGSLKIDWSPSERLDLYLKGYWHDWDSNWVQLFNVLGVDGLPTGELTGANAPGEWAFEDRGVNFLAEFHASEAITIAAGYDWQKYDGMDDVFLIAPLSEDVHAVFGQLKFDLDVLDGANLALGIRHNMPSDGQDKTVWNASGRLGVGGGAYVRGSVGTSFRLPSAYELYVIDPCCETGNPNLIGEESFNTEIGVGWAGDAVSAEVTGFYRKVDDLIGITYDLPAYPDGFLINTGEATEVWGAEVVVNARLSDIFGVTASYAHTDAKLGGTDQQMQDIPRDLAKLILTAEAPSGRFGATAAVNYVGDLVDSVSSIGRVEHGNYALVDLSGFFYIDADQRHRLGVRVENLFDTEYDSSVIRVRRDSDNSPYPVGKLGTPLTLHVTYKLSL